MILSVGFVTILFSWCIYRVIRGPGAKHEHDLAHVEPIEKDQADQR
ncbi:MAG: hypothetical protein IPN11_04940 [Opitutaceae bacterium]|nr:hypothetical protein [Opitutaceae bacterium]